MAVGACGVVGWLFLGVVVLSFLGENFVLAASMGAIYILVGEICHRQILGWLLCLSLGLLKLAFD